MIATYQELLTASYGTIRTLSQNSIVTVTDTRGSGNTKVDGSISPVAAPSSCEDMGMMGSSVTYNT